MLPLETFRKELLQSLTVPYNNVRGNNVLTNTVNGQTLISALETWLWQPKESQFRVRVIIRAETIAWKLSTYFSTG